MYVHEFNCIASLLALMGREFVLHCATSSCTVACGHVTSPISRPQFSLWGGPGYQTWDYTVGLSEKVNGGVENSRGGGWQVWQPQNPGFLFQIDFLQNYKIKSKNKKT